MTPSEFKNKVEANTNLSIYKIEKIKQNGHSGYRVTFAIKLSENSVGTERSEEFWNCTDRNEVAEILITRYENRVF